MYIPTTSINLSSWMSCPENASTQTCVSLSTVLILLRGRCGGLGGGSDGKRVSYQLFMLPLFPWKFKKLSISEGAFKASFRWSTAMELGTRSNTAGRQPLSSSPYHLVLVMATGDWMLPRVPSFASSYFSHFCCHTLLPPSCFETDISRCIGGFQSEAAGLRTCPCSFFVWL